MKKKFKQFLKKTNKQKFQNQAYSYLIVPETGSFYYFYGIRCKRQTLDKHTYKEQKNEFTIEKLILIVQYNIQICTIQEIQIIKISFSKKD